MDIDSACVLDLSQSLLPELSGAGSFSSSVLSYGAGLSNQANAGTSHYYLSLNSGPSSHSLMPYHLGQTPGPSSSFAKNVLSTCLQPAYLTVLMLF